MANNGLTFNTTPPSFLSGSPFNGTNNTFGCATISDNNGNLLFSSDGVQVWDKNNIPMPNGFGLRGEFCNINGILIIPFISDTSKYYLFTSQGLIYIHSPDTAFYRYSIVDMNANGGLGDVTTKNILIQNNAAEKMVAIPNANGTDIWWVCRNWTNHFYSYKIGCNGFINSNPIVSTIGNNIDNNQNNLFGDIKASSNGKLIAVAFRNYFEIYQFDNTTGLLSNPIIIKNLNEVYGVEFSPDSKVLYITQRLDNLSFGGITQYNLSVYDSAAIENSRVLIANISETGLQLGPDNKIYAPFGFSLNVINNPNTLGTGCNFQPNILTFPNLSYRRMPYAPPFLFTNKNVQVTYSVAPDCRTVTLNAKTYIKGNSLAFNWKFGDGDSSIQNIASGGDTTYTSIVHTYPPGIDTFFASLSVTSDTVCGIGRAGAKVVVKPPPPIANFGFTNPACGNAAIRFTDSSLLNFNPSLTYQWAYRPAASAAAFTNFSTAANPFFNFAAYDSFEVQLTATSSLSCVPNNSIVKRVYLKAKPLAAFTAENICGSLSASFSNTSTVAADTVQTFFWDAGNGQTSTVKNPRFTFADYGSKTVTLAVTSGNGCASDTFSTTVQVRDKPQPTLAYNNNACADSFFTITATNIINGATIASQQWLLNDRLLTNNSNIVSLSLPAGSYVIKYLPVSSAGCTADTAVKNFVAEALPVVNFTATGSCAGNPIFLQNNSTGNINSYQWVFGNGDSSAVVQPGYAYPAPGNYTIRLSASTANNCTAVAAQPITIKANPIAAFNVVESCPGKAISIVNTSIDASSNSWQSSDGQSFSGSNPAVIFNTQGEYTLQLLVQSASGCSDSSSQLISIKAVKINAGNDTAIVINQPLQLSALGAASYTWQPAGLLINAASANPVFKTGNSGVYPLQVLGTSSQDCQGKDTIIITVYKSMIGLLLPTAFSPNGDNLNDVLKLNCTGIQSLQQFSIYNRYGQTMYEQQTCNRNIGWDGKFKGVAQNAGAYVYYWRAVDYTGKTITGKGTVVLLK